MAKQNEPSDLITMLDGLQLRSFWQVFRERILEKAKADKAASEEFADAHDERFDAEACRRRGRQEQEHAETYRKLACADFDTCHRAYQLLAAEHPTISGEFPVLDWDIVAQIEPLEMAQKFRALLGKVLALGGKQPKAKRGTTDRKSTTKIERNIEYWEEFCRDYPGQSQAYFAGEKGMKPPAMRAALKQGKAESERRAKQAGKRKSCAPH